MKPSDLTAFEVRQELEKLIEAYPDRTGIVVLDPENDDTSCVYYMDEFDQPINLSNFDSSTVLDLGEFTLKTPVCIVGTWIEEFHPEFKEDNIILDALIRNQVIKNVDLPFDPEVRELLRRAQDQQDVGDVWGKLDLDKVESRFA